MRSESEAFEAHAQDCDQMAEKMDDGRLRYLFGELARQWRELADISLSLRQAAKEADEFYRVSRSRSELLQKSD
jgi:hypothetical protein